MADDKQENNYPPPPPPNLVSAQPLVIPTPCPSVTVDFGHEQVHEEHSGPNA